MCAQTCLTLCNPINCSMPHSSVHEIFQVRILDWVAISSSRGSSPPRIKPASHVLPALQVDSLPLILLGSPLLLLLLLSMCHNTSSTCIYLLAIFMCLLPFSVSFLHHNKLHRSTFWLRFVHCSKFCSWLKTW